MLFGLVEPAFDGLQRLAALVDYWVVHWDLRFAAEKFSSVPSRGGGVVAGDTLSVIQFRARHAAIGRLLLAKGRSRFATYLVVDRHAADTPGSRFRQHVSINKQ